MPTLTLARKEGQSVVWGQAKVTVTRIKGKEVRLTFEADPDLTILREELARNPKSAKIVKIPKQPKTLKEA